MKARNTFIYLLTEYPNIQKSSELRDHDQPQIGRRFEYKGKEGNDKVKILEKMFFVQKIGKIAAHENMS